MTLGFDIRDFGVWLFPIWLCIDGYLNLDQRTEGFMKAMLNTGMNVLAVLWGQVWGQSHHRNEGGRISNVTLKDRRRFDSAPHTNSLV